MGKVGTDCPHHHFRNEKSSFRYNDDANIDNKTGVQERMDRKAVPHSLIQQDVVKETELLNSPNDPLKLAAESEDNFSKIDIESRGLTDDFQKIKTAAPSETRRKLIKMFSYMKEVMSSGKALAIAADLFQEPKVSMTAKQFKQMYKSEHRRDVVDRLLKFVLKGGDKHLSFFLTFLELHDEILFKELTEANLTHQEELDYRRVQYGKVSGVNGVNGGQEVDLLFISDHDSEVLYRDLQNGVMIDCIIDHLLSSFLISIDDHASVWQADEMHDKEKLLNILRTCSQNVGKHFVSILVELGLKHVVCELTSPGFERQEKTKTRDSEESGNPEFPIIEMTLRLNAPTVEAQLRSYLRSQVGEEVLKETLAECVDEEFRVVGVNDGSVKICIQALNTYSQYKIAQKISDNSIKEFLKMLLKKSKPTERFSFDWERATIETNYKETESSPNDSEFQVRIDISDDDANIYWRADLKLDIEEYCEELGSCTDEGISFQYISVIGTGINNLSIVYKGQLGSSGHIAVKRMTCCKDTANDNFNKHKRLLRHEHKNVVRHITVDKKDKMVNHEGRPMALHYVFVVMELCDGDLQDKIDEVYEQPHNTLPTSLFQEIAEGLSSLHSRGAIHGSLALSRILLKKHESGFNLKLGSFSAAKFERREDDERYPFIISAVEYQSQVTNEIRTLGTIFKTLATNQSTQPSGVGEDEKLAYPYCIQKRHAEMEHLLDSMLSEDSSTVLRTERILDHPVFWSNEKILDFLKKSYKRHRTALDTCSSDPGQFFWDWISKLTHNVQVELINQPNRVARYDATLVSHLLRALRNLHEHLEEIPPVAKADLVSEGYVNYWLSRFPKLLIFVYDIIQ